MSVDAMVALLIACRERKLPLDTFKTDHGYCIDAPEAFEAGGHERYRDEYPIPIICTRWQPTDGAHE